MGMGAQAIPPLAAVLNRGPGVVDDLLAAMARRLGGLGLRLAGVVQSNPGRSDRCACDMVLEDLASGRVRRISQDLGAESRACRLDAGALEEMAGLVEAGLTPGLDLLIINRFGKREAEGAGFRTAIVRALDLGIPVLVGLSPDNRPGWDRFSGGMGRVLEGEGALDDWLAGLQSR